jgi:addiction module HigA family antidote
LQPVHPGILLGRSVFPGLHLSIEQITERLEVSDQEVNKLLSGEIDFTPALANKIGELVGDGADIWLRMQRSYNEWCEYKGKTPKV